MSISSSQELNSIYSNTLSRLLLKKPKIVNEFGCTFYAYYDERVRDKKVISLSFWKGSPGYLFSLQTSILEWVRLREAYYRDWYIRIYIDINVFKPFHAEILEDAKENLQEYYQDLIRESIIGQLYCILSTLEKSVDQVCFGMSGPKPITDKIYNPHFALGELFNVIPGTQFSSPSDINKRLLNQIDFYDLFVDYVSTKTVDKTKSMGQHIDDFVDYIMEHDRVVTYIENKIMERLNDAESPQWFEQALVSASKHSNIELWFYNCQWGKCAISTNNCSTLHLNTFGSLVRFHPFVDKSVNIVVVRNIEYLTSKYDKSIIDKWIKSSRAFCIYAFPGYICKTHVESYRKTCAGLDEEVMILANINYNKWHLPRNYDATCFSHISIINTLKGINIDRFAIKQKDKRFPSENARNFSYGVDELILTLCIKTYIRHQYETEGDTSSFYLVHLIKDDNIVITDEYEKYLDHLEERTIEKKLPLDTDDQYNKTAEEYRIKFARNDPKMVIYRNEIDNLNARYFLDNTLIVKFAFPGKGVRFKTLHEKTWKKAQKYLFRKELGKSDVEMKHIYPISERSTYQHKYLKYKLKYLLLKQSTYNHHN